MTVMGEGNTAGEVRRAERGESNGLAIAALVCGIVAIPSAILLPLAGVPLGIVALVMGVVVRRHAGPTPRPATAGLVTGVVAMVIGIVNGILGALLMTGRL